MIPLEELGLPHAVVTAVTELEVDIDVQKHSNKGANGYLFFGEHRIMNRRVAVKFYGWGDGRSHDEPRLLSEIQSSHVIPIYSARFVDDEWAMFQTPHYPRGDLDQVLAAGSLSVHQAIDHAIEILVGVSDLHGAGFVHRDLKPGNVFIDDEGRGRIGDFGSVKALPAEMTEVEGSGHSVLYRPPESFEHAIYTKLGDLYQCGVVLYQLLGGALPYDVMSWLDRKGRRCWDNAADDYERTRCVDHAIARRAGSAQLLDFDTLPGVVSDPIRRVIRRSVRPDAAKRFGSPSLMIEELRKARSTCHDWLYHDDIAVVTSGRGTIRLRPVAIGSDTYRAESNLGNGWRKIRGLATDSLPNLARAVEGQRS